MTKPPIEELEGGFLQVANGKVYKGTVREKDSKKVHWTCRHVHSRPEYNARWQQDESVVWEASALNCGRKAREQWPSSAGFIGMVGEKNLDIDMRDDTRYSYVGTESFLGRVWLSSQGKRLLRVSHTTRPYAAIVSLDKPGPGGVIVPNVMGRDLEVWATAAWLLRGAVWGVVFQDPHVRLDVDDTFDLALRETLGADYLKNRDTRRTTKPVVEKVEPHISISRSNGRRVYEVIGADGEVIETFVHRGLAVEKLEEVRL